METFLLLAVSMVILIIGIMLGYIWGHTTMITELLRQLDQVESRFESSQESNESVSATTVIYNGMNLTHEVIGEQHYFYNSDDSSFVCQGSSLEAAALAYSKRQGNDYVGMFSHYESNKQYFFLQGQVHESSESTESTESI